MAFPFVSPGVFFLVTVDLAVDFFLAARVFIGRHYMAVWHEQISQEECGCKLCSLAFNDKPLDAVFPPTKLL